jgi:hypothetical protein
MFTVVKIHPDLPELGGAKGYMEKVRSPGDLGWFKNPPGTVAGPVKDAAAPAKAPAAEKAVYACPMHPEVTSHEPGKCPKCGMDLRRNE